MSFQINTDQQRIEASGTKATESAARGGVLEARGVNPSNDNCCVLLDASVCLLRIKISLFASVK